ncbi:hypothetical protein EYF80_052545 [Liparis tanakae]|uniref:Uncharacterized protein n=1 Tax=Liparis tanakae TaxID=230148 RepID=A0A4Z2F8X5_9TELE|nr:hypothetical protein EYF80_052545 [Liparis tanakae]
MSYGGCCWAKLLDRRSWISRLSLKLVEMKARRQVDVRPAHAAQALQLDGAPVAEVGAMNGLRRAVGRTGGAVGGGAAESRHHRRRTRIVLEENISQIATADAGKSNTSRLPQRSVTQRGMCDVTFHCDSKFLWGRTVCGSDRGWREHLGARIEHRGRAKFAN